MSDKNKGQQNAKDQNKGQQNPLDQKKCNELALKMESKSESKKSSQSKMQSFMQGTGFKKISGAGLKDYRIAKRQFAKIEFKDVIAKCRKLAPYKEDVISQMQTRFTNNYIYDQCQKNFPIQTGNKYQLRLLRIQFIKKPTCCYMGYQVFDIQFQLAPHLALKTYSNSSSSSQSLNFSFGIPKVGKFGFGAQSSNSSSNSYQQLIQINRGLNPDDLQALINIFNIGDSKRDMYLEMFRNNQFQGVDY